MAQQKKKKKQWKGVLAYGSTTAYQYVFGPSEKKTRKHLETVSKCSVINTHGTNV